MNWHDFLTQIEIELSDDPTSDELRDLVLDKVDYFKAAQLVAAFPDLMHREPESQEYPFKATSAANIVRNLVFDAIAIRQEILI